MSTDIIQRLRDQLPPGASITEDDHAIIFRAPGQKPVIYNALRVTCQELEHMAHQIIEWSRSGIDFRRGVQDE